MGPLSLIKDLPENFLVMNGDILSDVDFGAFHDDHVNSNALFSISSFLRETVNLYGVLDKDENDLLTNFREKPVTSFEVSMGVYMANRKILDHIPHNESYGFDKLMLDLLKQKKGVRVKRFNGYWLDIGRPDDYMQAIEEFESRKSSFLPPSNDKK
jgi:NDP-sugar pyrophosphorylase family protein